MEGEMNNFAMVWFTVFASLCYIHTTSKFIPKGTIRFLTILPISILFILLPLNLTTIHLGATSSFFVAWLANFKILLFAFGKGPLSSDPPFPLSLFIPLACLPIKIHHSNTGFKETPSHESNKKPSQSYKGYVIKLLLLCVLIKTYDYKQYLNPNFVLFLYCFHIYFSLELILAMFATLARVLMQAELEPQFDEPYLTTSLQDFWGKRWNLMVSNGTIRFICISPVICLYTFLPLYLNSINLGCTSTFLISWLTNFKILLFAFSTGPLYSDPPVSLTRFISLACLPIKIKHINQKSEKDLSQESENYPVLNFSKDGQIYAFKEETKDSPFQELSKRGHTYELSEESKDYPFQESPKKGHKSIFNYAIKFLLFATLIKIYNYKDDLHPNILLLLYCFHIYFVLELLLAVFAAIARSLMSLELEPQFDDPYLATSLQDFWGKRWNLMVSNILLSNILRPTIFVPVRNISTIFIGKNLATLLGVITNSLLGMTI